MRGRIKKEWWKAWFIVSSFLLKGTLVLHFTVGLELIWVFAPVWLIPIAYTQMAIINKVKRRLLRRRDVI